jgi:hypothetical protein
MSAKAIASLNNSIPAQAAAAYGQGTMETTAVATVVPAKGVGITDQVTTTVANRQGAGTTPPATATGFDRTVATTLGK